jgi:hypothetical protein
LKPARRETSLVVRFLPELRADRGKLRAGGTRGVAVHAGSFLRRGEIVLDSALLQSPPELARILTHELFHFAWLRLGNPARRSFERLLGSECRRGVAGELGWSAEHRKRALTARDCTARSRRWREYVCESFCDTAAWLYTGGRRHGECTLPGTERKLRRRWFAEAGKRGWLSV